ncbi:hypothetical protein, partial [Hydrogenibacillus schlegelii]|uniref:hypothetical protein n=1 Tax=Hydrogenibacillus schlegelii TaxID=1484 RepID=UPI0034A068CA
MAPGAIGRRSGRDASLAAVAPEAVPPPEDGAAWRVLWDGATAGADAGVDEGCSAEGAHSALWTIEEGTALFGAGDGSAGRWFRFPGRGWRRGGRYPAGPGGKGRLFPA